MITQLWTKLFRNVVFYHYFRAKDDLLDSLADKLDSQYANAIKNMKPEMNSYEKLIQLSLVLSTQVIKKGEKYLLNHNRYYFKVLNMLVVEG